MYQRPERVKMDSSLLAGQQCAQSAECSQPEVHREMDILANSLNRLEAAAEMLAERLSCVTIPPAPTTNDKNPSAPLGSPLGSRIRQESDRVHMVCNVLEQLQRDLAI